jgi:hypothetical protein
VYCTKKVWQPLCDGHKPGPLNREGCHYDVITYIWDATWFWRKWMMLFLTAKFDARLFSFQGSRGRVPILPKVTNIVLQIFVTCSVYIWVIFNQYSLVGQVFVQSFWVNFLKNTCKIGKICRLTNIPKYLVGSIFHKLVRNFTHICKKFYTYL